VAGVILPFRIVEYGSAVGNSVVFVLGGAGGCCDALAVSE
jgi:hypothetical protein